MACRYTYKGKTYEAYEFDDVLRAMSPSEAAVFMPSVQSTPSAPFVGKTDAYVSLALKRIVKMAVDGGYDKVAFVTGEQSAERYDLSKQVDSVTYSDEGVLRAFQGRKAVITRNAKPEELTDLIGKEAADRLMKRPSEDGYRTLSGEQLKVGGEGMKAFYDRIVPSVLKDVLRKVGGGQVGEVTIGSSRLKVQEALGGDGFVIFDEQTKEFYRGGQSGRPWVDYPRNAKVYLSETSAKKALPQIEGGAVGNVQPGFPITPAMREQVARGLPLFSQVEATTLAASTPPTWDAPAPTRLDNLLYAVQNKQIDLKRVTDAIKESGQQLTDRKDPYLREELYHGRAAYRVQRFAEGEVDPLLKEMRMAQVSVQALDEYLHARHARERNAEMKARNLNRPDNDALSGMSDADAAKILANARPVMRTLAARVDAIIEGTRNLLEVAGLETPEMVDALRNSYQHYVPLHRDELDTTGGQGTGMGYSIRGSTVKRATGSTAAVTNILAHVVAERERVITRAEKNVVGLALYATALQNPNEDFWKPDTPPQKSIIDERVNVFNPGTGQMEANPNYGQVVLRTDPGYKSQPNVLVLRVNGEDRALVFNDRNERAMRMATSLKNLDVEALGAAGEAMAWATRHLAAVNTQYNPVFAVKNMVRDLGAGMANLSTTEIAGKQLQVLAGVAPALSAIYARERGDAPVVGDWGDAYELYQKHGGKTAFREQFVDIDARAKDLMKKLDGSSPADAVRPLTDFVADVNTAVENAVRLSAFRVALANGVSKDRAASLAKNLTVNFNRKGAKTRGIAAFYAFFNAAIQGNARLVETLKGPMGKQIAGGMLTLGFVQALLLASMDPEDEENVPGYIKRTSFVIPNGKNPIYIPLPLGLHVFPNIGRAAAETIFDFRSGKPNATEEAKTRTVELLGTLLDALSPVGGVDNPVLTMLPTPVDWVGALAMNRDWQNRPISRERGPGEESRPGYEMGRDSTSPAYKAMAKGIHSMFNPTPYARNPELPGMLSPTPEAIRYIPESLLGGVWRETEKLLDFTRQAAAGDEIDQGRIPLLSAFRGDLGSNMAPVSAFWKHVGRADAAERAAKGADRNDAEAPNDPYLDLAGEARAARKALADINKERRELALEGYDANKAQIRALEKEAADVMREFNSAAREALSRR